MTLLTKHEAEVNRSADIFGNLAKESFNAGYAEGLQVGRNQAFAEMAEKSATRDAVMDVVAGKVPQVIQEDAK